MAAFIFGLICGIMLTLVLGICIIAYLFSSDVLDDTEYWEDWPDDIDAEMARLDEEFEEFDRVLDEEFAQMDKEFDELNQELDELDLQDFVVGVDKKKNIL